MGKMRVTTEILSVPFDVCTMDEAVAKVLGFFEDGRQHIVCTPNPEIVMEAQTDGQLMSILKAADLVVPDGVGVVWASQRTARPVPERVAGYDLCMRVLEEMAKTGKTAYFFGGAPDVAATAAKRAMKRFDRLKVLGAHNGYFDEAEERKLLQELKNNPPDLLLVGLGAQKQEKWIYENLRFTKVRVAIGVGGCFDVMAGNVKRAPKIFRKLGLEWFYRLISQPSRWRRMLRLPQFVLRVMTQKPAK